jgi:hypothetical protein
MSALTYLAAAMKAMTPAEKATNAKRSSAILTASNAAFKTLLESSKEAFGFRYNEAGHAKIIGIPDQPTPSLEAIAACHKTLLDIVFTMFQDQVLEHLANEARAKDSAAVILDCTSIVKTLASLDHDGRPIGEFWARWLVLHLFMGYTPGFSMRDVAGFSAVAAEHAATLKEQVSLPSLGRPKDVSIMGALQDSAKAYFEQNFDADTCNELNIGIHLEGTALTGAGEFFGRTLVLVMTTGSATDEYVQAQKDSKRKAKKAYFSGHGRKPSASSNGRCKPSTGAAAGAGGRGQ